MQKEDTFGTDFVTSIPRGQFLATSENTKNAFRKFQVCLSIWRITWNFINSLFEWAFRHDWKIIAIFVMHSFFCWRVYLEPNLQTNQGELILEISRTFC